MKFRTRSNSTRVTVVEDIDPTGSTLIDPLYKNTYAPIKVVYTYEWRTGEDHHVTTSWEVRIMKVLKSGDRSEKIGQTMWQFSNMAEHAGNAEVVAEIKAGLYRNWPDAAPPPKLSGGRHPADRAGDREIAGHVRREADQATGINFGVQRDAVEGNT